MLRHICVHNFVNNLNFSDAPNLNWWEVSPREKFVLADRVASELKEFLSLPWYWVGNLIQICGMKLLYLCCITVPQLKPDYMATSGAICRWLYSHQISDCLAISGAPYLLCGVKTSALSPILCYTSTPDGSFLCIRRRFSMHNLSFFWKC